MTLASARLRRALFELIHHVLKLVAEENGDDGRRRLVGAEAMVVGRTAHRDAQQFRIAGHRPQNGHAEDEELSVVVRRIAGIEQVLAGVGGHRPVVVLARTVDAGERLLVQETRQTVLVGGAAQDLHRQHLVIGRQIGVFEDRRYLILAGSDFVVPRLDGHGQLEQFRLGLGHARQHALGDGAEVLVLHLLALGRPGAEQSAAGVDEIGTGVVEVLVDEEVFLLGTDRREDLLGLGIAEQTQNAQGLVGQCLHRTQQRSFLVEGFAGPAQKGRRNDQGGTVGAFVEEGGRSRVPGRVAARLEGRTDATGGK